MKKPVVPSRGEIWKVNLDPVVGHEQGKQRPALVLSVDALNHRKEPNLTVVPLTSTQRDILLHVHIKGGVGGLKQDSWLLCDQIRTLSYQRFSSYYGEVGQNVMAEVERQVKIALGLR